MANPRPRFSHQVNGPGHSQLQKPTTRNRHTIASVLGCPQRAPAWSPDLSLENGSPSECAGPRGSGQRRPSPSFSRRPGHQPGRPPAARRGGSTQMGPGGAPWLCGERPAPGPAGGSTQLRPAKRPWPFGECPRRARPAGALRPGPVRMDRLDQRLLAVVPGRSAVALGECPGGALPLPERCRLIGARPSTDACAPAGPPATQRTPR